MLGIQEACEPKPLDQVKAMMESKAKYEKESLERKQKFEEEKRNFIGGEKEEAAECEPSKKKRCTRKNMTYE